MSWNQGSSVSGRGVSDIGDVVRHPRHGVGVIREVGAITRVGYLDGIRRHSVRPPILFTRLQVLEFVEEELPGSSELDRALFIWLRSKEVDLWLPAAVSLATRPGEYRSWLLGLLSALTPRRRETLENRLATGWSVHELLIAKRFPLSRMFAVHESLHTPARISLRPYQSHCWRCHSPVSADSQQTCGACGWVICDCGACRDPRFGGCYMCSRRVESWTTKHWQNWYR
jgi:hypothetical protein